VLFIIYGAYFGLSEGAEKALVADMVPDKKRGTAYGLYNLAFGITVFPASLLFGLIWNQYGASAAFIASGCVSLLAVGLLASISAPRPKPATE
jgi:MFS-type transporter involved in bile tolerance (Atg22 family)